MRGLQNSSGTTSCIDVEGVNAEIAYMHMAKPALVRPGRAVSAGQAVGHAGETGRASWVSSALRVVDRAWWRGGTPVDPVPYLREWGRKGR